MKETRVYAIPNVRLHHSEYSDEEFIEIAERNGDVYSIKGFQDKFNCDGNYLETSSKELDRFMHLQIRFIEVDVPDQNDLNKVAEFILDSSDVRDEIIWLLKKHYNYKDLKQSYSEVFENPEEDK